MATAEDGTEPSLRDRVRQMADEMRGPETSQWNVSVTAETLACRDRISRRHHLTYQQIAALAVVALEGLLDEEAEG